MRKTGTGVNPYATTFFGAARHLTRLFPWRALALFFGFVGPAAVNDQLPEPLGQDLDHLLARRRRARKAR